MKLNSKQRKTLEAIFSKPTKSNIIWKDIENLLIALGAEIKEGNGSRIRIKINKHLATFHRPHPRKETIEGAVEDIRRLLKNIGVEL